MDTQSWADSFVFDYYGLVFAYRMNPFFAEVWVTFIR